MALSREEVVALLVAALGHDGRHDPGDELVQAGWLDTADRAGWTFPEALDAVHRHYVDSDAYLSAGAVTRLIRERRALAQWGIRKREQLAERARRTAELAALAGPEHAAHREHLRRTWPTLTTEENP